MTEDLKPLTTEDIDAEWCPHCDEEMEENHYCTHCKKRVSIPGEIPYWYYKRILGAVKLLNGRREKLRKRCSIMLEETNLCKLDKEMVEIFFEDLFISLERQTTECFPFILTKEEKE